ncbi:helix-turn-helix transcriptional regulator [Cyanobacterium sp. Dongsha4]|uniref:helix-turn-helix domain-containing protein n=1 Tax=Cyanobacterium sp. DS4 TaxID=2878255 RepID=UPI002E811C91|nr:helix-turn-helix transcriptional regulator [Cyanobacterium sp. Dongsha4]WVL00900.1 helix-turn-helix transcriptional regulator [Cyanobacterium sp. Dongsha4]
MTTEIINKNGKDYAVIPYDFYQKLIEDAEMLADIKAYDTAKNKSEETFPFEVVDSICLKGENPIKVYRQYRGISIIELSKKTKIDVQELEKIENNIYIASQKNLEKIAENLKIDLDMIT